MDNRRIHSCWNENAFYIAQIQFIYFNQPCQALGISTLLLQVALLHSLVLGQAIPPKTTTIRGGAPSKSTKINPDSWKFKTVFKM